ncbi:MAG: MaoC/PaaZ C-terminal domain-containing protein [Nocardioidaceae bacterium]|nr:MaoC/PaaZ C-terminal domain-containing protein [Nocardioidaceae bacterium]
MTTRTVDGAPSTLPLYLRAALPALPGIGSLPGVRHSGRDVPDLTLRREGVGTDLRELAEYARVCGFPLGSDLPVTYPHMAAFALHLQLMCDTAFPFAPMGLVHLRNTIVQHRPIGTGETFDVEVRGARLRPHPKGRLVDIDTSVTASGALVWEEVTTLLARGSGRGDETSPPPLDGVDAPLGSTRWRLPADLGRRYAAVSGDRNPIHLYQVTAKAFGFPRQIAHGMWTTARALAALEGRLPDAVRVDVEFRRPVLLPTTVQLGTRVDDRTTTFGVTSTRGEKTSTHLVGRAAPA